FVKKLVKNFSKPSKESVIKSRLRSQQLNETLKIYPYLWINFLFMKVSVDISLYPIKNDYREPILDFIQDLKNSEFTVIENSLSTQIFGDYDQVMPFLNSKIKDVFFDDNLYVFVLKIVKGDRSEK